MKLASMANEAGFNRQRSLLRWASKLYSFLTHISREFVINKKSLASIILTRLLCSGGGTRTHDLRIMNPTL